MRPTAPRIGPPSAIVSGEPAADAVPQHAEPGRTGRPPRARGLPLEQRRTGPAARNPRGAVTQGDAGASDALHGQALSAEAPRRPNVAGPPADRAESVPSRVRGGTQPQASKELRARRQLPAEVVRQLSETVHMQVLLANGFAWDSSLADDLDDVRLDSARQLSAIAHRDVMPPESANLVFAKLVKGRALILNSAQDQGGCRSPALAGLLFLGEHHNRWKAHNGMRRTRCLRSSMAPARIAMDSPQQSAGAVDLGRATCM